MTRRRPSGPLRLPANLPPARHLARLVAAGRIAIGAGMVARPGLMPGLLGVDSQTARRMSWAMRMLGVREIVLGAGTLAAGEGPDAAAWILGGAACDAVDAVAFAGAARRGYVRPWLGALFAATAVAVSAGQVAAVVGEEAPLD